MSVFFLALIAVWNKDRVGTGTDVSVAAFRTLQ